MSTNILMQSSDYYSTFAGVSLTSLFENNKNIDNLVVYLIDDNISEKNKKKFILTAKKYERTLIFIDAEEINSFLTNNHVPKYHDSYTTLLKLFCLSKIRLSGENLIYIDSDTICSSTIAEFSTLNLSSYCCAMVEDFAGFDYKEIIGRKSQTWYNAGVIVFNVDKWKNEKCEERIINHIVNDCSSYPIADQDILNVLFYNKIYCLSPKYNYLYTYEETVGLKNASEIFRWPKRYYEQIIEASVSPVICHCFPVYGKRPWHRGGLISKKADWDYYLSISQWSDYVKEKSNFSIVSIFEKTLIKVLPAPLYNKIHRIAYLRGIKRLANCWRKI